jgi:hypothetical protein
MTNRPSADASQEIVVYAGPGVEVSLPLDRERETVWASQAQIVDLFGLNVSSVSRHINNIFRDSEVDRESNLQKVQIASADRPVTFYSLDVILAVGYRANSSRAIQFRAESNSRCRVLRSLRAQVEETNCTDSCPRPTFGSRLEATLTR